MTTVNVLPRTRKKREFKQSEKRIQKIADLGARDGKWKMNSKENDAAFYDRIKRTYKTLAAEHVEWPGLKANSNYTWTYKIPKAALLQKGKQRPWQVFPRLTDGWERGRGSRRRWRRGREGEKEGGKEWETEAAEGRKARKVKEEREKGR